MKLLLVSMNYDYGDPNRGRSYEYNNFYNYLSSLNKSKGSSVESFERCKLSVPIEFYHYDFMENGKKLGINAMSRDLLFYCRVARPDIVLFISFDHQHNPNLSVFKEIEKLGAKTIHWGCDDDYRWDSYTKHLCSYFWGMITTYHNIYREMKLLNINALKSQWACNPFLYQPLCMDTESRLNKKDIIFVGQPHTNRKEMVDYLLSNNINLKVYGYGWENYSRISDEELPKVFAHAAMVINTSLNKSGMQIKGRHFEVPACGTLQLTDWYPSSNIEFPLGETENALDEYFKDYHTISYWRTYEELLHKIKMFSSAPEIREDIARNSFLEVAKKHTWGNRLQDILKWVGDTNVFNNNSFV